MVHFTLTVLAVSMSALAATVHNRGGMEVRAEPGMLGTAVAIMSPQKRDDAKVEDAKVDDAKVDDAKVKGTKDAIQNLKEKTDGVPQDAKDSAKEALNKLNGKVEGAKEDYKKEMEEAEKKIPDPTKEEIEKERENVQNRFNELSPGETRVVLKGLNEEKKQEGKKPEEKKPEEESKGQDQGENTI